MVFILTEGDPRGRVIAAHRPIAADPREMSLVSASRVVLESARSPKGPGPTFLASVWRLNHVDSSLLFSLRPVCK